MILREKPVSTRSDLNKFYDLTTIRRRAAPHGTEVIRLLFVSSIALRSAVVGLARIARLFDVCY